MDKDEENFRERLKKDYKGTIGKIENEIDKILISQNLNPNKKNVEYETTKQTKEMAKVVRAYNDLLAKTFIDIPDMNKPMLEIKEKNSERTRYVNITHHGKFTHRVLTIVLGIKGDVSMEGSGSR